jgi:nucleotide-binding universal stress UspA family protein
MLPDVILIAYDGSDDARAAIEQAGALLPGEPATVLTVWEPFVEVMAHTGLGLAPGIADYDQIDAASTQKAGERASEGVDLAAAAGLDATARTTAQMGTIAEAIIAAAEDVDARLIVVGSRGLTGIKSLVLGSVSHAVLAHTDLPVLVIRAPAAAAESS